MTRPRSNRWQRAAARLAEALPRERFHPAVLGWVDDAARSRAPWGVALSGGADSVALLLLLWAHWPRRRALLRALHFDHQLRGAASRRDAEFCRRLCSELGVALTVGEWQRTRGAEAVSEADARTVRLAFLARHARVLWFGHQQDDVAETMLMRLARGSGSTGLAAPRPVQPMPGGRVHLRPLLGIAKRDLAGALRAAGAAWREDATNRGDDYFRNRIRRDVVPVWAAAARRDAVAGAARSRELLAEDDEALEAWVDELEPLGKSGDLLLRRLAQRPKSVLRRALHRWLRTSAGSPALSRQAFETLLTAVHRGEPTRQSLGPEWFAVIRRGRLICESGKRFGKFRRGVN